MNISRSRWLKDLLAKYSMLSITIVFSLLLLVIIVVLVIKSAPVIQQNSFVEVVFGSNWRPMSGRFGMFPFIISTLWVTFISIIFAVPLCILAAVYLSEYANKKLVSCIFPLIDILAGIPSVVFGVWGIIVIVPLVRNFIGPLVGISTTGYSILAGGVVLGVMIIPVIIHVLMEVFKTVPVELREAALSLGSTKWETTVFVVLRKVIPGIIAAVVLGLSRAFGETMAVLMVVGNVVKIPKSPMDPGYPLPALIANNYGEMMSIPNYDSALMLSALILLVIVIFFNAMSKWVLLKIEKRNGYT